MKPSGLKKLSKKTAKRIELFFIETSVITPLIWKSLFRRFLFQQPLKAGGLLSLIVLVSACSSLTPFNNDLQPIRFADLEGWNDQQASAVRPVLLRSCRGLKKSSFQSDSQWGDISRWQALCDELARTPDRQLLTFFELNFKPVQSAPESRGLFTGYYSPIIQGSLTSDAEFSTPLLKLPDDLITVNPSDFGSSGKTLAGKLDGQQLIPYDSRADINLQIQEDELPEKQVLIWLKNPTDRFFLQIQGSGYVSLNSGEIIHIGYAGNNGLNYVSIGKILKDRGDLTEVSMQSIRHWLERNSQKSQALFNQNPRYIFFKQTPESNSGVITAQGIPATPFRTLAIDTSFIPLGMPVWVETTLTATGEPFRQLMVAQDTGSAIKGPVRGDIYMGVGEDAAYLAGNQQSPGKIFFLIPR